VALTESKIKDLQDKKFDKLFDKHTDEWTEITKHAFCAARDNICEGKTPRQDDVLKMLMAGADVTMLCSTLLAHGIEHIRVIENEMGVWMEEHWYESVRQLKGSLSQMRCPDPSAFERAQYMRALTTYKPT